MFGRQKEHKRKKPSGIFLIARTFLSLIMLMVLALGVYQAYKSFSGYDPLKISPEAIGKSLLSSDSLYKLVAGALSVGPKNASLDNVKKVLQDKDTEPTVNKTNSPELYKFAFVADPHKDTDMLARALKQAKAEGAKFVIGLGDMSDVGTLDELRNIKTQFDAVGLPYYVAPGDHDMWDSRNQKLTASQNFTTVFGVPYQSFSYENSRFILIFNTDNYLGLDGLQLKWIEDELARASTEGSKLILVGAGTPLYHPSSDHLMGRENPKLKDQAEHLISIFQKGGVREVFAGDTHFASHYVEPKTGLKMTTVGAVTSVRNPQAPRFSMVRVNEDGTYEVKDVEIK